MYHHSVVVCNLYWQLLLLLQPKTSPDSAQLEDNFYKDTEQGKNLFYCVHNLQTKLIQEWVIYMGIYRRV
jgi:hypothetical protein